MIWVQNSAVSNMVMIWYDSFNMKNFENDLSTKFRHCSSLTESYVNSKFGASTEDNSKTQLFLEDSSFTPIFKILARTLSLTYEPAHEIIAFIT